MWFDNTDNHDSASTAGDVNEFDTKTWKLYGPPRLFGIVKGFHFHCHSMDRFQVRMACYVFFFGGRNRLRDDKSRRMHTNELIPPVMAAMTGPGPPLPVRPVDCQFGACKITKDTGMNSVPLSNTWEQQQTKGHVALIIRNLVWYWE